MRGKDDYTGLPGYQTAVRADRGQVPDADFKRCAGAEQPDAVRTLPGGGAVDQSEHDSAGIQWAGAERGNPEVFEDLFGFSRETGAPRPTNSEYIARIADKIRMDATTGEKIEK